MSEERLLALDTAIPAIDAIREHEASLHRTRTARGEAEARRRALADELGAHEPETDSESPADLDARIAAFGELDALRVERASASVAGAPAIDPARILAAAAVALAGLLVGIAVGAVPLGAAAGIGGAAAVLLLAPRRATAPRADIDRRWRELCDRLDLAPDAGPTEIRAMGERLAEERVRRELVASRRSRDEARREELVRRERELERAADAQRVAEQSWCAWLRERGLDDGMSPEAARQVLTAADAARRAAVDREVLRGQLAEIEEAEHAYATRVDELVVSLGLPRPPDAARRDARLVGLGERLDAARDARRRAMELGGQIAQLEGRREPAAGAVSTAEAALAAFLEQTGCPDPDAVRGRAVAADRRRATQRRERELRERLIGLAGNAEAVDDVIAESRAADHARLEAEASDVATALEETEQSEREANAAIGAVDAAIERLEATAELGDRRQEVAQLEGRAAAMAREWAVRALALRLLETTRARHERERQPDVVRAAESHFDRITGGRYARIVAPPGEASVRVETEGGESRSTEELSRGTSEQLYLALRFGLIEEFASQAEALPVVMDDILVNFDADRAARAASAIGQLAQRHQVLYFTCHAWTAELLDPSGERTVALG